MLSHLLILLLTLLPASHAIDDDCDALAELAEGLRHPALVKYAEAKTARGKISAFKKADAEGQRSIVDSLALARLRYRGSMTEVEMFETMFQLVRQDGVPQVAAGNAIRHLVSVFASVKDPQIMGKELTSKMTGSGYLEAQSNASFNRGKAIEMAATLVAEGRCTEFEQLLLLKGLREAVAGSANRPPMDFLERRYLEQALSRLAQTDSKLEVHLRPQLRDLIALTLRN